MISLLTTKKYLIPSMPNFLKEDSKDGKDGALLDVKELTDEQVLEVGQAMMNAFIEHCGKRKSMPVELKRHKETT